MNVFKVDDGIYRGSQPLCVADYKRLSSMGIKYTLDLETGSKLFSDGDPLYEAISGDNVSIRVYNHPLGEILPPTQSELFDACHLMTTHRPTFVHCKAGVDRTGMVCAYYRMTVQGWTREQAVHEMKTMGMHWWYAYWRLNL